MNPVIDCMTAHRSIRRFTPEPVPDILVKDLLAAAQCAATSSHVQAYSVIQVHDKETRQQIANLAGPQIWVETAPVFLVFCADIARLEAACRRHGVAAETGWAEQGLVSTVDTALLGQNMMLAAESVGLGGVFIGGIRNDPESVCRLLDIPDQVYPVFGLCLGYPDQDVPTKPRLPLGAVLHDGRYNAQKSEQGLDEYDKVVNAYYADRSPLLAGRTWTSGMADFTGQKVRPHMKSFLESKGFFNR